MENCNFEGNLQSDLRVKVLMVACDKEGVRDISVVSGKVKTSKNTGELDLR